MNEPNTPQPLVRGARRRWWRRIGRPGRFRYVDADGHAVVDAGARERIRALAIPPAWTQVRISPSGRSRLQVLGLDGGGKLQYLYHPRFVARRQQRKFDRVEQFAEHLPRLRDAAAEHLAQDGLTRDRVLAAIVRVINRLYFRVGSEDGVKKYRTYGITTLRPHHVTVHDDGNVEFRFHGKHHIPTRQILVDEHVRQVLRELKDAGGRRLFQYRNGNGNLHSVRGADVNDYIKTWTAPEFTAKDFRTWAGTLLVAQELARIGPERNRRRRASNIGQAVRAAAQRLGNTPAVCRRAYLHPAVLDLYNRGFTIADTRATHGLATASARDPDQEALLELFYVARALKARTAQTLPQEPSRAAVLVAPEVPAL